VAEALEAGVEAVTWSGDKLLGGPQAGLVAGRRHTVQAMRRNPLYRALRVDKMTLAALDVVLVEYQRERTRETVPVQRMLALEPEALRTRAEALRAALALECPHLELALDAGSSVVGGGAAPGLPLPTTLIAISDPSKSAARFAAALRACEPPVVTRIAEGRVLVDLRTVLPDDEPTLRRTIAAVANA
jgi:L-seryl-tRNA(Ser) seleniumtransferase